MPHGLQKSVRTRNQHQDFSWKERCNYWRTVGDHEPAFTRSRRVREPLVLTGHGSRLWINNGCLMVRNGFTHFPQKANEYRFFPNDSKRPERIIVVDGSGSISFDALDWLTRNDVPLIRLNWRGEVQTVLNGYGSTNIQCIEAQPKAKTGNRSLEIAKAIISEKLKNSISTLNSVLPKSKNRTEAITTLKAYLERVKTASLNSTSQLMGIEGAAAIAYFGAWRSLPIKWEGTKRKPIPSAWYQIGLRSSVTRQKTKNRNASHPVNAMLNYAYGVLESQIRIWIIANGFDPRIGFLHTRRRDGSALIFDLMEPMRPKVDLAILSFIKSNVFTPSDFIIRSDGVCRLHPNLAATIVDMFSKVKGASEFGLYLEKP